MKIRNGFVSNSSSSSFVIDKIHLNPAQIAMIRNYDSISRNDPTFIYYGGWVIDEDTDTISGRTWMDNFDMEQYLIDIVGLNKNIIKISRDA